MPWLSGHRVTPVLAQKSKTGEKSAKEIRKKVIEDAMLGYREERLGLVGTRM
jgi:hypothetical protein